MTTVAMVTMASEKMSHFAPENHTFGPGAIDSKVSHEILSLIYVPLSVPNQAI